MYKTVRKFNGSVDPSWAEEGCSYQTHDFHLGSGSFRDATSAARRFVEESRVVAEGLDAARNETEKMDEYRNAMKLLSDPTPRDFSFTFLQDKFVISGDGDEPEEAVNKKGWFW